MLRLDSSLRTWHFGLWTSSCELWSDVLAFWWSLWYNMGMIWEVPRDATFWFAVGVVVFVLTWSIGMLVTMLRCRGKK